MRISDWSSDVCSSDLFRALAEVIGAHGLFCSLYTDRGSHYFHTPKAGGTVATDTPTQVGRALAQLGIRHIAAYSPEARGRGERLFGPLQARLPPEPARKRVVEGKSVAVRIDRG